MLQTFLAGAGPIRFGYGGIINIQSPYVGTDMIALSCTRPEGNGTGQEKINQNPFVKSFHSFKGIAHDFWDGADTRREKSLDSTYDFINMRLSELQMGFCLEPKKEKARCSNRKPILLIMLHSVLVEWLKRRFLRKNLFQRSIG